jgi:hypothetical protein
VSGGRAAAVGAAFVLTLALAGPGDAQIRTRNAALVGHFATPRGFNGDVWVHAGTAYMGGYGVPGICPRQGVRALDVRNPAQPTRLSAFARFRGTTSEDVWVGAVATPFFRGDLAAVGIQARCSRRAFRGLALYDVTRPAEPLLLGRLSTGSRTHGVHELSVAQRSDGGVLVYASVPHSLLDTRGRRGDVRIIDATNPRRPVELADWDVRRNAPARVRRALRPRVRDELLAHSVWPFADGMRAFVSHWDAGVVFLGLANPARPRYLGRTRFRRGEHGNAHSGWFRPGESVFVQNDEVGDFHGTGIERSSWGFQRIFRTTDLSAPVRVARFALESAVPGADGRIRRDGFYSVHNNVFVGDVEYVSWYSAGVRVVDLSNASRPREIAFFVPPPRRDPHGYFVAPNGNRRFPMVWGVYPHDGLVYASDINSGLWIFRVADL